MAVKTQAHCIHCFTCAMDGLVECEHCGADLTDVVKHIFTEAHKRKQQKQRTQRKKYTPPPQPQTTTQPQKHEPQPPKIFHIPLKSKDSSGALAFGIIGIIPVFIYPPFFFVYIGLILCLHIIHANRKTAILTVEKLPE